MSKFEINQAGIDQLVSRVTTQRLKPFEAEFNRILRTTLDEPIDEVFALAVAAAKRHGIEAKPGLRAKIEEYRAQAGQ